MAVGSLIQPIVSSFSSMLCVAKSLVDLCRHVMRLEAEFSKPSVKAVEDEDTADRLSQDGVNHATDHDAGEDDYEYH